VGATAAARHVSTAAVKTASASAMSAPCERRGRCCECNRQTGSAYCSKFRHDCFS
jgi:hypothetical protein